jgi:hypothetical protein
MWLVRALIWLVFTTRLYTLWSRVYRWLYEREVMSTTALKTFETVRELGQYLNARKELWKADSWKQLFDAISSPEYAQQCFEGLVEPRSGLDCDEYAVFAANALKKSLLLGRMALTEEVSAPQMLSVMWRDGDGLNGHNVCLARIKGSWVYMDYGAPRGHSYDIRGVALAVLKEYAKPDAELLAHARMAPDLKLLEIKRG